MKMDLDKTPPRAELEGVAMELAAAKELATSREATSGTKHQRSWDVPEPVDESVDPNKMEKEWSKEASETSAPRKRRSRWDATPAEETAVGEPKKSRWDQAVVIPETLSRRSS